MSLVSLLPVVLKSGLEWLSAQVAELIDSHSGVSLKINLLDKFELPVFELGDVIMRARVDQPEGSAMFIALVSVKEHKHAEVSKVALTESVLVKAVNLGVCQNVSDTLQVDNHQVAIGVLPGKVAESLGNEGLLGVLMPPSVVVVLLILSWNVGLTKVVLVWGILIGNLVDESLHEFNEIS